MAGPEDHHDRRRRYRRRSVLVTAGAAAALVAVPALTGQEQRAAAAELTPFAGCADVDAWFTDMTAERVGPWGLQPSDGGWFAGLFGTGTEGEAAEDAAGAAGAPLASAAGGEAARSGEAVGPGATGTNTQETGVDEPDLVKTDGRRVVTVTHRGVHVLEVNGDDLEPLGTLRLPEQMPQELLLLEDRLLVIGQREVAVPEPLPEPGGIPQPNESGTATDGPATVVPAPQPWTPTTTLAVVDISDPTSPRLVRTEEVEASYLSARATADAVRVVLTSTPVIPFVQPGLDRSGTPLDEDEDAASDANRKTLAAMSGADWLPHRVVRDTTGAVVERSPVVECDSVAHPEEESGLGTVTVLTLERGDEQLATTDTTAVTADGGLVYASPERLYVATTRGGWGRPMPVDGLLSDVIGRVAGSDDTTTQLHGFDITAGGTTQYVASGSVPGWLLGRWAMSARDGMLRVATTTGGGSPTGTEAVVTVLDERDGALVPVGSVGGLGKGEEIRAVRWFDDLAVVVTFRQTDPLYTVDLSDPAAPAVVGELKIPGYSAYLHPLGDGLLLGVGQDATDTGQTTGAQVSSFDLRDLASPERVDTLTYPRAWSDVEGDSRAFSYLPDRRVALLPLSAGDETGVVAVSVSPDGALGEAGRWTARGGDGWLLRAMPVGDASVVAVLDGEKGRTLTLLGAEDLSELDDVALGS